MDEFDRNWAAIRQLSTVLRRADGVYRWFQVRALPWRDTEGRIIRWYILRTDIDDRKQAEDRLQLLLDVTNQVVSNLQLQRPPARDLGKRPARHAMRSGERLLPGLGDEQIANLRARFSREQRIHSRGVLYSDRGVAWWFCLPHSASLGWAMPLTYFS